MRQRPEITSTLIGARTIAQLDNNLASVEGLGFKWGDTTVNGVRSAAFTRA